MDYDVFISCKSEDYKYAEEIYSFLTENGINTFLASKELRKIGETEYRSAISKALKSTYHMIVFASEPEYVDSNWVNYEWDIFITAKLKGFKSGQILTILKDTKVDDINMELWKYESFSFEGYKERLLDYVETPASLKRKSEMESKKKREEEQENHRKELEAELKALAEDYRSMSISLRSVEASRICALRKELGLNKRTCPVCGVSSSLDSTYCPKCGWGFSPIDGIKGMEYLAEVDSQYLAFFKSIYAKRFYKLPEPEPKPAPKPAPKPTPKPTPKPAPKPVSRPGLFRSWWNRVVDDWKEAGRNTNIVTRILIYLSVVLALIMLLVVIYIMVDEFRFVSAREIIFTLLFLGITIIATLNFLLGRQNGLFYLLLSPLMIPFVADNVSFHDGLIDPSPSLREFCLIVYFIFLIYFASMFLPKNKATSWSNFREMNKWFLMGTCGLGAYSFGAVMAWFALFIKNL